LGSPILQVVAPGTFDRYSKDANTNDVDHVTATVFFQPTPVGENASKEQSPGFITMKRSRRFRTRVLH